MYWLPEVGRDSPGGRDRPGGGRMGALRRRVAVGGDGGRRGRGVRRGRVGGAEPQILGRRLLRRVLDHALDPEQLCNLEERGQLCLGNAHLERILMLINIGDEEGYGRRCE